jgi:hypothetical protein
VSYTFIETEIDRQKTRAFLVYNTQTEKYETAYVDEDDPAAPIEVWLDSYFGYIIIKSLHYEYSTGNVARHDSIIDSFKEVCYAMDIDPEIYIIKYC